jgi:thiamine pyrophosphokinase
VADGDVRRGPALDQVLAAYRSALVPVGESEPWVVVAADGGAVKALELGLRPHLVVGDGDSLPSQRAVVMRASGSEVIVHPAAKDESDTELAVLEAVRRGATRIWIVGAVGGPRLEHEVANLLLLSHPIIADVDARIVDGWTEMRVIGHGGAAAANIDGAAGDYVSLLPLSDSVEGVTTRDLLYPLVEATLSQGPARGLSNELTGRSATVTTKRGRLAVIHTIRSEEPSNAPV